MLKPIREISSTAGAWELQNLVSREDEGERVVEGSTGFSPSSDSPSDNSSPTQFLGTLANDEQRLAMPRDVLLALTYGLELVRCGAMLVKGEGFPQFANRTALEILKKSDGLALARTGLVAERASDTRMLRQLLREAIHTPELGEPKGSPITLPRKAARSVLIVRFLPGPGLDCWQDKNDRAALVTIYDEENSVQVDESVLCKLYGLTRGEAAIAAILLKGKSIDDAAAELFISPHTARTHLKRIFMKTDTHRQTELVVRIFSALL
jgi:DNA-binding CsgD family transcriptional regulator